MNPLLQNRNQNPQGQQQAQQSVNPYVQAFKMMQGSNNPMQMLQNLIQNSPDVQNVMNIIQNQYGGDGQKAFYDLASRNGINPEDVLSMFR